MFKSRLRNLYIFLVDVKNEFVRDHGTLSAAAVSFFGLISFIPLILLGVGVLGYIVGSHQVAMNTILTSIKEYAPVTSKDIEDYLINLSNQSGLLSGLGLLGLLWSGTQVFVILQQVMNVALEIKENVGFFKGRAIAVIVVAVTGILIIISIGLTSLIAIVRHYELWGLHSSGLQIIWNTLGTLVSVFISMIAFTLIYKYLPTKDIGTKGPIIGGITAGLLFELAKYLFKLYVTNFANFNAVYGSLASVVVMVLWIYYVSMIAVFGAEIVSVYVKENKHGG